MSADLYRPPVPTNPRDASRWRHTSLVRRIVDPELDWTSDASTRVKDMVGTDRQFAWKTPDTTAPLLRVYADTLCRAYAKVPGIAPPNDRGTEVLKAITQGRHWVHMQESQAEAWAAGELFVRVDIDRKGRPTFRRVTADRVTVEVDPERPDQAITLREAGFWREAKRWVWHVYDISNENKPSWRVYLDENGENGKHVSKEFFKDNGLQEGDRYRFRLEDGEPFIPYAVYRGVESGRFWHPYGRKSLVEATLNIAVYLTYFGHVLRNASWPQRYVVNADFVGAVVDDAEDGRPMRQQSAHIIADPATIVRLTNQLAHDSGHALVGQWQPGADPKVVFEALQMYISQTSSFAGVSGSDQMRITGDPRSAYAIHLSRSALREEQARTEPILRRADEDIIRMTAALMSRHTGKRYPEEGYTIEYLGIPEGLDEVAARRQHILELMDRGLASPVDAYRTMHPGCTDEEAVEALLRIQRERKRFFDMGAALTDPAESPPAEEEVETPEDDAPEEEVDASEDVETPEVAEPEEHPPLTGQQIREALVIVEKLTAGEMEPAVGEILLVELGMAPERAKRLVSEIKPRPRPEEPEPEPEPEPSEDDEE